MKKIPFLLFTLLLFTLLSGCSPRISCEVVDATSSEAESYNRFIDSLSDGFNLDFEVFAMDSAIKSYNTSGKEGCPGSIEDLQGIEKTITTKDGEFELIYEKITETKARIGVKDSEGRLYYYAL